MERVALSQALLEALRPGWVQRTFRISSESLRKWRNNGIPPARLPDVLDTVRALTMTETAPPEWARRLDDALDDEFRQLRADLLDRVAERLADLAVELAPELQSSGEGSADSPKGLPGSVARPSELEP